MATNTGIIVIQLDEEIEIVQVSHVLQNKHLAMPQTRHKEKLNRPGSSTAALI